MFKVYYFVLSHSANYVIFFT